MTNMETSKALDLQEAVGIIWTAQCATVNLGDFAFGRLRNAKQYLEKQLAEYFAEAA